MTLLKHRAHQNERLAYNLNVVLIPGQREFEVFDERDEYGLYFNECELPSEHTDDGLMSVNNRQNRTQTYPIQLRKPAAAKSPKKISYRSPAGFGMRILTERHSKTNTHRQRDTIALQETTHRLLYTPTLYSGSGFPSMKRIGLKTSASSPHIFLMLDKKDVR